MRGRGSAWESWRLGDFPGSVWVTVLPSWLLSRQPGAGRMPVALLPPRTPGSFGQAAAALHAGDSRGCHGAVPVSSALHQHPCVPGSQWLGEEGPFGFRCLHLGGNQLPSMPASLRCKLAGLAALHASPGMSPSVPPTLGLLGACAPPSNPPPLANNLLAKLVINSLPSKPWQVWPGQHTLLTGPLPAGCPVGHPHHGMGHHHHGTEGPSPG